MVLKIAIARFICCTLNFRQFAQIRKEEAFGKWRRFLPNNAYLRFCLPLKVKPKLTYMLTSRMKSLCVFAFFIHLNQQQRMHRLMQCKTVNRCNTLHCTLHTIHTALCPFIRLKYQRFWNWMSMKWSLIDFHTKLTVKTNDMFFISLFLSRFAEIGSVKNLGGKCNKKPRRVNNIVSTDWARGHRILYYFS